MLQENFQEIHYRVGNLTAKALNGSLDQPLFHLLKVKTLQLVEYKWSKHFERIGHRNFCKEIVFIFFENDINTSSFFSHTFS